MRYLLVVGSRDFNDFAYLYKTLDGIIKGRHNICIVSGGARGADTLAKNYALMKGFQYKEFPAEWDKYGKSAGYKRNVIMHDFIAQFADRMVVAFWDGESKGTQHNFHLASDRDTPLVIIKYKEDR